MVFKMIVDSLVLAANAFFRKSGTAGDSDTLRVVDRGREFKTVQVHRKRFARHKQKRFSRKATTTKVLTKPIAYGRRAIF